MKDNNKVTATLMELAELAIPYDESSHDKNTFINLIRKNPELEKSFEAQYSEEFKKEIQKKGIAFIINNDSAKRQKQIVIKLSLYYCGKEKMPVIVIDY